MKKILIMLSFALLAISCTKEDVPVKPTAVEDREPVLFGSATEVLPVKAAVGATEVLTSDLGIYAFDFPSEDYVFDVTEPIADANAKLWCAARNVKYICADGTYNEEADPKTLFWQTTVETVFLKFVSYCPFTAVSALDKYPPVGRRAYIDDAEYELRADFTTQLADVTLEDKGKTFWFSWAEGIYSRPEDVTVAQELKFNYKVAKISLVIKGDGETDTPLSLKIGRSYDGTDKSPTDNFGTGVVSVEMYNGVIEADAAVGIPVEKVSTGLNKSYTLNLLTGVTSGGTDPLTDQATELLPITIEPSLYDKDNTNGPAGDDELILDDYIGAVGYLVPTVGVLEGGLEDLTMTGGIVIKVIYNDGTEDIEYTAKINAESLPTASFDADVNLTNGLKAGINYVYSLKLTQVGVDFTAVVNEWRTGATIPPIELE